MNRLLFRTSIRYLLRHPWQFGLCVLGVALGVAVVVAIDLATASAGRAFTLSTERVTGRATHQIVGGPAGFADDLYTRLRVDLGVRDTAPVLEGYVRVPALDGRTMQLFGVDPLAEAPFRNYLADPGDGTIDLRVLLTTPGAILLTAENAAQAGLQPGDRLTLVVGSREQSAVVAGVITPGDDLSRRALDGLLIADIAAAQELLDQPGQLSRIDLILNDQAAIDAIRAILPPGVSLESAAARSAALAQMTRAFELNLTALSLLALIVGMFLIYNTVTFSVVQRRGLLGSLRCLGVTRGQVAVLVLSEAAVISLIGALLGLALGVLLGRGLVGLVTQTINDLYYVVTVRSLSIDPFVLLKGLLLGIGATLAAAAAPAIEAMFTPPRTVLRRSSAEDRMRRLVPQAALAGVLLIVAGLALLAIPTGTPAVEGTMLHAASLRGLYFAFGGLFALVIGAALLTPALTVALMVPARPLMGRLFGLLGRMAARDVVASLSRTAVAVAALMVAVSVTIGVGLMVSSFRQTVIVWLEQSLVADVYVSAPSNVGNRTDTTITPEVIDRIATTEGVAALTSLRSVSVDSEYGPLTLVAIDGDRTRGRSALRFRQGGDAATWNAWEQGAILISEPLAYRSGLGLGDGLTLRTNNGLETFPIAGVYDDYSSDRGVIRMAGPIYRAAWGDPAISSLALYAAPDVDVDLLVERLRLQVADQAALVIGSNRALRAGTLEVFDRTFAITAVLQLLATIVAFIGILSALMALQLERARELALLRANGLTPRQLWGLVISQTGLMGLIAGVLAAPLGLALALVLIYVINRRSFGWTLDLNLDPRLFAQALLVALIAALLAGVYPAFRMSRTNPALALREE